MNKLQYPTKEAIRSSWRYENGHLFWLVPGKAKRLDVPIGSTKPDGYVRATRSGWMVHRLIWIYHFGDIPEGFEIDHINRVRDDNRIENLRIVTRSQNHTNRTPKKRDLPKGVRRAWHTAKSKPYKAVYKGKHLGYFSTVEEAHAKYLKEAREDIYIAD